MAAMNPILRLRRAFRSLGASAPLTDVAADDISEEAADAISEYGYSRRESDLRFERMMAEMRQQTAEMREMTIAHRRELLIEIIVIVGVAVAIIVAVN